jgi:hypothetical protein
MSTSFMNDRNIAALVYLRQGKYKTAVKQLSRALQHLASYSQNYHGGTSDGTTSTLSYSNDPLPLYNSNTAPAEPPERISVISPPPPTVISLLQAVLVATPANTPPATTSTRSGTHPHDEEEDASNSNMYGQGNAFYERAFELPHAIDQVLAGDPFRTHTTCVLLYNTALAYQLSGVQTGTTGRTGLLNRAVDVYGMIFTITGPRANVLYPTLSTLLLGVCNNLTQLHLELHEISHMKAARSLLRDFLEHTSVQELSRSDLNFFQLSLYCLELDTFHYALAA